MRRAVLCAAMTAVLVFGCGKSDNELMTTAEQQAAHSQWPDAMETYRTVIKNHPDGPRTAEALYRSGMIQYSQLKDFAGGAAKFAEVARRFPDAPEAPKSLMVLGFIYAEEPQVRNLDSARAAYQQLVARYPASDLAAGARIQLEHLGEAAESVFEGSPSGESAPRIGTDSLTHSPSARALAH